VLLLGSDILNLQQEENNHMTENGVTFLFIAIVGIVSIGVFAFLTFMGTPKGSEDKVSSYWLVGFWGLLFIIGLVWSAAELIS
jgi:hypothetical protein